MRSISPLWGFVVLILAAVLVSAVVSAKHPNRGSLPPAEQERLDEEKKQEEAQKQQAAGKTTSSSPASSTPASNTPMTFDQAKPGAIQATMVVQGRGTVVMELYPKAAPQTVAHFVELCRQNFYSGIKFHRLERAVAPQLSVLQVGDPESKNVSVDQFEAQGIGSHGSGRTVPLEAHLSHKKYSIGLARSQAPDSGDSQFYINLEDNSSIDGQYCIFGMVVQGQDVVDKIEKGDVIQSLTVK